MFGMLSQHSLHRCTVKFLDHLSRRASVFPLFDREGRTRFLMLTDEADGQVVLVPFDPAVFAGRTFLPRVWPQQARLHRANLHDSEVGDRDMVADLWHFDPWWELRDERYTNHSVVPTLVETNLPGFDPRIRSVWFDRTLGRVLFMTFGEGDEQQLKRFRPERLNRAESERESRRRTKRERPGRFPDHDRATPWRLRPFWETV